MTNRSKSMFFGQKLSKNCGINQKFSEILEIINSTRTIDKPQLSQHLRQELAMDSLRYEMELFAFIQSVLYKKYTSFGFHPEDWDPKFLF